MALMYLILGLMFHQRFLWKKIKEFQPQVVGLCGLLTLAFDSMKNTIEALEKSGAQG